MWWECEECGCTIERPRRPLKCHVCGTAGPVFTPIDPDDAQQGIENLRLSWFDLGFHRALEDSSELPLAA